jgi:hypothetical protein
MGQGRGGERERGREREREREGFVGARHSLPAWAQSATQRIQLSEQGALLLLGLLEVGSLSLQIMATDLNRDKI